MEDSHKAVKISAMDHDIASMDQEVETKMEDHENHDQMMEQIKAQMDPDDNPVDRVRVAEKLGKHVDFNVPFFDENANSTWITGST